ncbi:hypothetical protein ACVI1J_010388 [Bradyrhizobium diazoefficiens]
MSGLIAAGTKHVRAHMFFDQLPTSLLNRQRQQKQRHLRARLDLQDRILACARETGRCGQSGRRDRNCRQSPLESISQDMVILGTFLCDERLGSRLQHFPIAGRAGAYERNEEITASHKSFIISCVRMRGRIVHEKSLTVLPLSAERPLPAAVFNRYSPTVPGVVKGRNSRTRRYPTSWIVVLRTF